MTHTNQFIPSSNMYNNSTLGSTSTVQSQQNLQKFQLLSNPKSFYFKPTEDEEAQFFSSLSSSDDHEEDDGFTDDDDSSLSGGDVGRKSKRRRRKICRNFTSQEFIELMHLSQREAAKELNVCLSTFKRQFSAIRPKLSWPTPSQRKILLHRRRFQNIIEQNQEEFFPSTFFEFGKNNSQIFEEILPDPKVLSEECSQLRKMVDILRKENQLLREKLSQANTNTVQGTHTMTSPFSQEFFPSTEDDCDSTHEASPYDDSCVQQDFYSMDNSASLFGI